ncbi:MAG: DUF4301 family protein [Bacteroidales bacterium]
MFTDSQLIEIQNKGISPDTVEKQIERFEKGFAPIQITKPATPEHGIVQLDKKDIQKLTKLFNKKKKKKKLIKFTPASGAASRMFKMLYTVLEKYDGSEESYKKYFSDNTLHSPAYFFNNISKFAFYDSLKGVLADNGYSISDLLVKKDYTTILDYFLTPKGLNYGNLPKGMLLFHSYENTNRTAIEEHLVEGALYAKNQNGDVHIHFTVSPEFIDGFKEVVADTKKKYQDTYKVKFYITYSIQDPKTDTIAVNPDNTPFTDKNGNLVFRPAGHGALINNLNNLDADIVFIKNIDNVVPDTYKETTVDYKKALAGILIHYQKIIYEYYEKLEKSKYLSDKLQKKIYSLFSKELSYIFPDDFFSMPKNDCKEYLLNLLDRPIRVCGMVKNEGEPGGGPFFVKEADDSENLQIIEMAQLDTSSKEQMEIVKKSTHFNPVDIVCSLKNSDNKQYNLLDYVDYETGIISTKSKDGKELKALELPGLWNGAMANWTSIFVEVPIETFNPVKEVTDLLRTEHIQL